MKKSAKALCYQSSNALGEHTADLSTRPDVVSTYVLFGLEFE